MSASDDESFLEMASDVTPAEATSQGLAGVILAIFGIAIMAIEAFGSGISRVISVLRDVADFMRAFFTEPIPLITASIEEVTFALTEGEWDFFGPFTFAAALFAIAVGFMVWNTISPQLPFVDDILPWRDSD